MGGRGDRPGVAELEMGVQQLCAVLSEIAILSGEDGNDLLLAVLLPPVQRQSKHGSGPRRLFRSFHLGVVSELDDHSGRWVGSARLDNYTRCSVQCGPNPCVQGSRDDG
jgi:hypothetical protein